MRNASPLNYLPDYCSSLGLSQDAVDNIRMQAASIIRKDPSLLQESPQTVAAGLLKYYFVTNGIATDDPQRVAKVTGRSNVTIDGMYRRIASIDNS